MQQLLDTLLRSLAAQRLTLAQALPYVREFAETHQGKLYQCPYTLSYTLDVHGINVTLHSDSDCSTFYYM